MLDKLSISDKLTLQKMLAFLIVTGITLTLKDRPVVFFLVTAIIVYGHFFLGGLYKLSSKRKVPTLKLVLMALLGCAMLYYFSYGPDVAAKDKFLYVVTVLYAIFHSVTDDQFTGNFFKSKYTNSQIFGSLALLSLLASSQLFMLNPIIIAPVLALAGLFFSLLYIYTSLSEGIKVANLWIIFQIVVVILIIFSSINVGIYLFFFIGIYHVLLFYMHYFLKITTIEEPKNFLHSKIGYLTVTLLVNFFIIVLYLIISRLHIKSLYFIFSLNFFFIVHLLHFISSTRYYEFREFFKGSQSLVKLK